IFAFAAIFMIVFIFAFMLFSSHASADSGDANEVSGYEVILVHAGDTLDGLSSKYSSEYSHMSAPEYKVQIVRMNGLSSDYIREGRYLLMPITNSCK
ncbi:MAG: LysM peptidoglycan-binding domain-containing protein, partial [Eubacterium sp.]|nr:LysM peptidoglycan-binding domain-containing protein [Eubacterium sp.]